MNADKYLHLVKYTLFAFHEITSMINKNRQLWNLNDVLIMIYIFRDIV